jgi:hypothetical protein
MSFDSIFHGAPTSNNGQAISGGIASLGIDVTSGQIYYRTPQDRTQPGWRQAGTAGSSGVTGSGTTTSIPLWTSGNVLSDSQLATESLNTFLNAWTFKLSNITLSATKGIGFETHSQFQYGMAIYGHGSTAGRGGVVDFLRSRPTETSPTAVQTGDALGFVSWNGYDGTSYSGPGPNVTYLTATAKTDWTSSNHGSFIDIYTCPVGALVGLKRLTIDSNGDLILSAPGTLILNQGTPATVAAGQVGYGSATAATATNGTGEAMKANVEGYLLINVAGTTVKIPYVKN